MKMFNRVLAIVRRSKVLSYAAVVLLAACSADSGPETVVFTEPAPAPTVTLTATPGISSVGSSSTLTWTSTNATACTAAGSWTGARAIGGTEASATYTNSGTYSYVLTCIGQGGSASSTATVMVGTVAAPVVTIAVAPPTIAVNASATVTWSSTNSQSCIASGAWTGARATSGSFNTGTVSTSGSYDYTLTCTGPGGSGTGTTTLTVTPVPPPQVTLTATPATVASGGSSQLSWSSTNATSCAASGAWNGPRPTNSSAPESTGPLTTPGVNSYTLTCTGPSGSGASTATVTIGSPPAPTVTISVAPASITAGSAATLTWSSTDATACTASGSWSGPQPVSGTASTGTLNTAGVYTYSLTCTGPGGSAANGGTLAVTGAVPTPNIDCGVIQPSNALLSPAGYSAVPAVSNTCLNCNVNAPENVVDADLVGTFATVSTSLNLLGNASITVGGSSVPTFTAPRTVGFVIQSPNQLLTLGLLQNVTVQTLLAGNMQETGGSGSSLIQLDLLRLLQPGNAAYVSFRTTQPFDALRITDGNIVGLLGNLNVALACVSLQ